MKANINYTAYTAQAAMSDDARLDKAAGLKVTATSREKVTEQISAQCAKKHEKAELDHEASTTESLFIKISTAVAVVGTACAAASSAGMFLAMGGLSGLIPAVVCTVVPALVVGAIGNLVGRGLGGLAVNGTEEDAHAAERKAGEIDLERKTEINTMHRSGTDRIERGNEQGKVAQQNIARLLDNKVD